MGSSVPDYRGVFLRGYGSAISYHFGTTVHSSSNLGELQGDSIRNITGKIDASDSPADRQAFGEINTGKTITGAFQGIYSNTYSTEESSGIFSHMTGFSFDSSRVVPTSNEIRPVNKAVYYLIKAK